jgi:hypothetical protein
VAETLAKYVDAGELRRRLERLQEVWPDVRERIEAQLLPAERLRDLLRAAGCPTHPAEIGVGAAQFRASYALARTIRSRYTVLDLVHETGILDACLDEMFGAGGYWLRAFKGVLDEGRIGEVFRGRLAFNSSFPVFDNQPFLRELEQFILTDVGSHVLDVARFLFGDAVRLRCQTHSINPGIAGDDVATVMLQTGAGATVVAEMSYATRSEHQRFPETFVFAEGTEGTAELAPDHWIRVTTKEGTFARRVPPPRYPWADPAYDLVHASIVPCNEDLLRALQGKKIAETDAADNIRTVELVFAAYDSAASGQTVEVGATT